MRLKGLFGKVFGKSIACFMVYHGCSYSFSELCTIKLITQ